MDFASSRRVSLDTLTKAEIAGWKAGERLLLSGKLLAGRDAAHRRMTEMLARGEPLPVDFTNRFIYYVGPVSAVRDEAVGPAGPTTSSRMDRFTEAMLAKTGLIGMIGKSERGPTGIDAIKRHSAVYCIAVGGAAYLVSKPSGSRVRRSRPRQGSDLRVGGPTCRSRRLDAQGNAYTSLLWEWVGHASGRSRSYGVTVESIAAWSPACACIRTRKRRAGITVAPWCPHRSQWSSPPTAPKRRRSACEMRRIQRPRRTSAPEHSFRRIAAIFCCSR